MERPFVIPLGFGTPESSRATDPVTGPLTPHHGITILAAVLGAYLAFGYIGRALGQGIGLLPGVAAPAGEAYAKALSPLLANSATLFAVFALIAARAPTALRDRSAHGCAWSGASDEVVVSSFLLGGGVAALLAIALPPIGGLPAEVATLPLNAPLAATMLLAFSAIALAPVAEELVFRGVSFAALRSRISTPLAATLVTAASTLVHVGSAGGGLAPALGYSLLGACAMTLRLRHAALAPAIALHCGHAFVACIVMALI